MGNGQDIFHHAFKPLPRLGTFDHFRLTFHSFVTCLFIFVRVQPFVNSFVDSLSFLSQHLVEACLPRFALQFSFPFPLQTGWGEDEIPHERQRSEHYVSGDDEEKVKSNLCPCHMASPKMLGAGTDGNSDQKADHQPVPGPCGRFPVGSLAAVDKCCDTTGHNAKDCTMDINTDFLNFAYLYPPCSERDQSASSGLVTLKLDLAIFLL